MSIVNLASQTLVSIGLAVSENDRRENRQARIIALIITAVIATILLLALLLIHFITPIPAIPPDPEPIALEYEIGLLDGTGGDAENRGGGSDGNTGLPGSANSSDPNYTLTPVTPPDNGSVTDNNSENHNTTNSNHTSTTQQPSVSPETLAAMANWKKNKGAASINIGGDGKGDPYTGGLGNGSGSDIGPNNGGDPGTGTPGGQNGNSPTGTDNRIRKILSKPEIVNPTQEEGKVVVNVYINRAGKVVKTEVNPNGTTTINSTLRATATQSAFKIMFDADPRGPELLLLPIDIYFTLK